MRIRSHLSGGPASILFWLNSLVVVRRWSKSSQAVPPHPSGGGRSVQLISGHYTSGKETDLGRGGYPRITPDGSKVAYGVDRKIHVVPATGGVPGQWDSDCMTNCRCWIEVQTNTGVWVRKDF